MNRDEFLKQIPVLDVNPRKESVKPFGNYHIISKNSLYEKEDEYIGTVLGRDGSKTLLYVTSNLLRTLDGSSESGCAIQCLDDSLIDRAFKLEYRKK